jgi:hypothetical protein
VLGFWCLSGSYLSGGAPTAQLQFKPESHKLRMTTVGRRAGSGRSPNGHGHGDWVNRRYRA